VRRRTPKIALAVISAVVVGVPTVSVQSASADPGGARVFDAAAVAAAVDSYVASENAALFKSPHDTMARASITPASGIQYHAYERTHRGLPVIGGDSVVVTGPSGKVLNTYNAQDAVIDVATTTPAIGADAATATAKAQLGSIESVTPARLVVLAWGTPHLAWEVKLSGAKADGTPSVPTIYVDARSGKITESVDAVRMGTGTGFYLGNVTISTSGSGTSWSMQDSTRPNIRCGGQNGTTFTGTDDVWGNGSGTNLETACVDGLYAVQKEWDMLSQWLGRNGINGNGGGFPMRVGLNQANAFWNGSYTNFGRNSASTQQATGMDVVAHEFGHAIFQTTPGGAGGGNENGGINEGTGDIFGAITEHFANHPQDPPDYLVGEEVNLVGSGEIRNMFNPAAEGDPNCWSTAIPNTEVHAAAGPINHWFYLLAEGSNPAGKPASPTCNSSTVTGVGIQSAARIFYGALLSKTSTWRYANVRLASLNAAVNLFGANSPQCASTKAAWNAVSVPVQAGEPTCGTTQPPGTTVFFDDFETALGWTTNPNGSDTATTGAWQRGDPGQTTSGVVLQLGTTVSGVNDLVTGAAAGTSAGDFDVDGGTTSAQSPAITLPSTGTLSLSFSWYLAHLNNSSSADFIRVSVVNSAGTATAVLTQAGAASNRAGAWATGTANLGSFAGQSIRIRVECADASTASLVECGIDDVRVTQQN
jgi:Zn-dependent metalloprotease